MSDTLKLSKSHRKSLDEKISLWEKNLHQAEPYLNARGIGLETAQKYRLGVVRDSRNYRNGWLSIPYLTKLAGPAGVKFRCTESHECKLFGHGKYDAPLGQPVRIYNTPALFKGSFLAICEGELDALVLDGLVGLPAVGIPGSGVWQNYWDTLFSGFVNILVYTDGDEAGDNLYKQVKKVAHWAECVRMPEGEDVNSMYVKHGSDWFLSDIIE